MKRIISLTLIIALFFSFALSSYANEAEETEILTGLLCDADGDMDITAADARLILRASVGLDELDLITMLYSDADSDGTLSASDARTALRTSVGLENEETYTFTVNEYVKPACENGGYIKATCEEYGFEAYMEAKAAGHSFDPVALCQGEGECMECKKYLTFTAEHDFVEDNCNGVRRCAVCGEQEFFTPVHSFDGAVCRYCGFSNVDSVYDSIVSYITKYGNNDAGFYYITDIYEGEEFALCYDSELSDLYVCYVYYTEVEGSSVDYVCYLEIPEDLTSYVAEVDCLLEDELCAYAVYSVDAAALSTESVNNAVSLMAFDSVEYLLEYESEFAVMAEGFSLMCLLWLLDYSESVNINGVTASALGCPQLA